MTTNYPALTELKESLRVCGVNAENCCDIATAMLGIAHAKNWIPHPEQMSAWLQELALEVAHHWNEHEPSAFEEPPFRTRPGPTRIETLRRMKPTGKEAC